MKRKITGTLALAVFALGLCHCTLGDVGPGSMEELETQHWNLVMEAVDPPPCYDLRIFYRWVCSDGAWEREWAGRTDITCDGTVMRVGEETNCYSKFATYDCTTHQACGQYEFVCPQPTAFCRPVIHPVDVARLK